MSARDRRGHGSAGKDKDTEAVARALRGAGKRRAFEKLEAEQASQARARGAFAGFRAAARLLRGGR